MYGASVVGYKVNQKEERRRIVLKTMPFTPKLDMPYIIKTYEDKCNGKNIEDIHIVVFKIVDSLNPPALRRRK